MFKSKIIKIWDLEKGGSRIILKSLGLKLIYFLLGFFSSQGALFNKYNSLGISLSVAFPKGISNPIILGAVLGYAFLPKFGKGISYIAVILLIITLKWLLNEFIKIQKQDLLLPFICFASFFLIEIFVNYSLEDSFFYIYSTITEALILAVSNYIFIKFFKYFTFSPNATNLNSKFCYLFASLILIISSISTITFYKISVGRVLAIFIIVLAASCWGSYGGSVAGAALGGAVSMLPFGNFYLSGIYAFSGVISGMCSGGGKLSVCGAFLLCSSICIFNSAVLPSILPHLVCEVLIGVLIFIFVPKRSINKIEVLFSEKNDINSEGNEREKRYITNTIKSISDVAENAAQKTFCNSRPALETVCMDCTYRICNSCSLKNLCWGKERKLTKSKVENLILSMINHKNSNKVKFEDIIINKNCKKSEKIIKSIKRAIADYKDGIDAKIRAKELYNGMSGKFSFAGAILDYADKGIKILDTLDIEKSKKIKNLLSKHKIETVRTECHFNSENKMFIEIEVMKIDNKNLMNKEIVYKIEEISQRYMGDPITFNIENRTVIRIPERENFSLKVCIGRHNCNNGEFCGDFSSYFEDGTGKTYVIISDGMGTGGRAAADGTVTAGIIERLIKLRVDPVSAIKIANLSILGESSKESLTAIDVMSFDMYSGDAHFVKAGAPLTLIKKGNQVNRIESSSLPIGIFEEINASVNKLPLSEGDLVIMMSDGVTDIGTDWIKDTLLNFHRKEKETLADYILEETVKKRDVHQDDDVTVITIDILNKLI